MNFSVLSTKFGPGNLLYNDSEQILSDTDWTAIASVADPAESNPYLTNRQEFLVYRSAVRAIVLNPAFDSVFPEEPIEVWSS